MQTLLTVVKSLLPKTKVGRFVNSFVNVQANREGICTPEQCETLDGQKGAACCKLGYWCPVLNDATCTIYNIRPRNCKIFPANEEDLKLVRNCGYWFRY